MAYAMDSSPGEVEKNANEKSAALLFREGLLLGKLWL
jgi:hypothetical protein